MNPLYERMPVSVFERMSLAATHHGAVNLGQGFPDFGWPDEILEAAAKAVTEGSNQYAPSRGLPVLREVIASHYKRHFGQQIDPDHVCVTSGATEAISAMILATVEPGDEVVILTPAYDCYAPMVRRAGGVPREVALQPPLWRIEADAIRSVMSDQTRAIILNNPHNPSGRIFDLDELQIIADIAIEHDIVVISDEVWEHVLLDGGSFTPIAALPGMAERTLKAGSAGKIFSLTGWKIGWIVASPEKAAIAAKAHQFLTFSSAPNLQAAVAFGLEQGDAWIRPMRQRFSRALRRMSAGLVSAGFEVLPSASTYFLCVDLKASGLNVDDETFASAAVEQAGVATVPLSAFAEASPTRHLVRLCFAKRDETIDAGVEAMARAKELFV